MKEQEFSILGKAVTGINGEAAQLYSQVMIELDRYIHGNYDPVSWGLLEGDLMYVKSRATEIIKALVFLRKTGEWGNPEELNECIQESESTYRFLGSLIALCKVYGDE